MLCLCSENRILTGGSITRYLQYNRMQFIAFSKWRYSTIQAIANVVKLEGDELGLNATWHSTPIAYSH